MTPSARRFVPAAPHVLVSLMALSIGASILSAEEAPKKKAPREKKSAAGQESEGTSVVTPDLIRSLSWRSIGPANMGGGSARSRWCRGNPPSSTSPFIAAGEYELTLSVGKEKSTSKLTVIHPPGVGPEPAAGKK